ncbi:MAG: fibrinogen-like YCDxxxxGGGW domain-containing protein, partial [Myxococcota bacterium]|nr:fibrinogen-like YCDxxxxGGGW domain-containing protein [Myxococcota bacterium]
GASSTQRTCDPYLCGGDVAACPESCVDSGDCAADHVCTNGVCGLGIPRSCASLLASQPQTQSGNHQIDTDGPGGDAPYSVYCDMDHQGGGWTNLNFDNDRILLSGGQYIHCSGGMASNDSRLTCTDPMFNGNDRSLYLHRCDGGDDSPTYLLLEVAPEIGHRSRMTLGFTGYQATQNGAEANPVDAEYCYANGTIDRWDSRTCRPYKERRDNTTCAVGLINWIR